jgi:DNA-binding transcriptional MerR regulator
MNEKLLTIEELAAQVEALLEKQGLADAQPDGRVSPVPDVRTTRYYTTLGLLDRPKIVEREARYSRRHVLQLAAVKALQAAGLSLAEIQERLYGRSESELDAILASMRPVKPALRSVLWREVTLEPGLKILIEEGWSPRGRDASALEDRIRAAVSALIQGVKS